MMAKKGYFQLDDDVQVIVQGRVRKIGKSILVTGDLDVYVDFFDIKGKEIGSGTFQTAALEKVKFAVTE